MNKSKAGSLGLALGALGIVFGDIGTSPLYVMQAIFGSYGQHLTINTANVYGVVSLMIWVITLVVSVKYLALIMRADNQGEGGIMALIALIKSGKLSKRRKWFFIMVGLVGVSLFYGDSAITPAISVLSAIEGLKVVAPGLTSYILPATLAVLSVLFWIQRYGTGLIGKFFGPIMFLWFFTLALGGLWQIILHPEILSALNPATAVNFAIQNPLTTFVLMSAIVLVITGAEALYADMGHFGRAPIARAWFFVVFPSLVICYMGQAALILNNPQTIVSPLLLLYPTFLQLPFILLATFATLIASQSVISGAFSLTRQAVQLDFLPKMLVRHTSNRETGQVYVPFINVVLYLMVVLLVIVFGSSEKLASAYGVAVSGTLAADTILFIVVMRLWWRKSYLQIALATGVFVVLDAVFVLSNLPKILHGGLYPVLLAVLVFIVLSTWSKGRKIITAERRVQEGSLQKFIESVHQADPAIIRVPGRAVYLGHHEGLAPLALHAAVEQLHELHEKVVVVTVAVTNKAHVPEDQRAVVDGLGYNDGICAVSLKYGFSDNINVPRTLESLREMSPELDFDQQDVSYFVSLSRASLTKKHNLAGWRKSLYSLMSRNSLSTTDYYKLPVERTIEISSLLEL